jgi:hypothetical protein
MGVTKPRVLIRPAVIMALLAGACSDSGTRENVPVPAAVVPNAGYATVSTAVEISGAKFLAKATQQSSGGSSPLDTTHRAWLGNVELTGVTWVDASKLTATVPVGLPLGAQKLTVENAFGERGTLDNAFTVLAAPAFSATVSVDRTTVNVGQPFALTLALANDGGAEVNSLALGEPVLTPANVAGASPCGAAPAAPAALALGGRQSFNWTCQGAAPGQLTATFGPTTGKDALLGSALTATPPASVPVTVQTPAALTAAPLSIPALVAVGTDFTVKMTVANTGEADARAVAPGTLSVVPVLGAAAADLKAGPTPASALVQGGQSVDFVWTYTPTAPGSLSLAVGASGTDGNSGSTVTAVTNGLITVQ